MELTPYEWITWIFDKVLADNKHGFSITFSDGVTSISVWPSEDEKPDG